MVEKPSTGIFVVVICVSLREFPVIHSPTIQMFTLRKGDFRMFLSSKFHLMLVVLVLLLAGQADSDRPKDKTKADVNPFPRILGGNAAPRGRFPYMCSLRRRGSREHICGGVLIKRRWVLTAAHCVDPKFDGSVGKSALIYCGIIEGDERNTSKDRSADATFIHPEWKRDLYEGFDIAIIKLDSPYDLRLPDLEARNNTHKPGSLFAALGWGQTASSAVSDLLQIAEEIMFVARRSCNNEDYWNGQIKDSMVCAGTEVQDTQQGDSGGPLLQLDSPDGDYKLGDPSDDLVVGVTSFGRRPDEQFKPGVYTSVAYFREWIDCIMEEKEDCSSVGQGPTTDLGPGVTPGRNFSQIMASINARTAIYEDDSAALEEVLREGLSPETQFSLSSSAVNWTLLHVAAKYDAIESARVLIGSGADIEKADRHGNRSLHVAARYNAVRVVKLLIRSGAEVDSLREDDWQPLHVAAFYDFVDVAKLLINSGASVDSRSNDGSSALHLAAAKNSLSVAKLLLDKEADTESKDVLKETPLHRAADMNSAEVAKYLIDAGANVNSTDDAGQTPLHDAAWWGSLEVVVLLVYGGADVNGKDNRGYTSLHTAARANRFDIAEFLINNGGSRNERDNYNDTPYDEICKDSPDGCSIADREKLRELLVG